MKINEVKINEGRRVTDQNKIKELADSIKELGLLNPITVNEDGTLIAGMHRLEACKLLGYEEIKVNKINLNALLAELAEIDENLVRNELHWLEIDKQLRRRKAIYEQLHPETKQGLAGAIGKHKRANEIISSAKTFTEDTADKLGQSQRNIQMSVARAENIIEEIEEDIIELDITKTEGTILSRQEPEQQKKIVKVKKENRKLTVDQAIQEIKKEEKKEAKEEKKKEQELIIQSIENHPLKDIETNLEKGWYKVGNQFLYYGSNTDEEFKAKLPKAKFAFADPPYNAGVDEWDFNFKWELDYIQEFADVVAVTPGGWNACNFYKETQMNYIWEMFCWISNGMTHGKCGYANVIKTAIFGNVKPKISQDFWKITIKTSESEDTKHKGRKPYDFMIHLIDLFTNENDIIIDPFAGSGTTLLMSEQMNRVSYNAELDKQYCIDIIKRIGTYERI